MIVVRTSILRRRSHMSAGSVSIPGFQKYGRCFLHYFWTIVNHFFEINRGESRVFSYNSNSSIDQSKLSDKFWWVFKKNVVLEPIRSKHNFSETESKLLGKRDLSLWIFTIRSCDNHMTPFQRDYPTKKYRHFLIAQKSFIISNLGKYALFCRENRCVTSQTYSIMAIDKRIVISFVVPVIQHGRHESLGNGCKPPIGKVQEHRLTKNRRFGKLQL